MRGPCAMSPSLPGLRAGTSACTRMRLFVMQLPMHHACTFHAPYLSLCKLSAPAALPPDVPVYGRGAPRHRVDALTGEGLRQRFEIGP